MMSSHAPRSLGFRWPMLLACFSALRVTSGCRLVDTEAEAANGCEAYASDACQVYARCGAPFLAPYGSIGGCNHQLAKACTDSLAQPDGIGSGAGAAACGELLLGLDCNAIINGELPPGCQAPAGRRSDRAPCSVGGQCASARCAKSALDAQWGECRERVGYGEPCLTPIDCQAGMVCSPKNACVVLGGNGEACSEAVPCRAPLFCEAGRCTSQPSASTPQEDAAACQAFGTAICARLGACSAALLASEYGDPGTCATRNASGCMLGLHAPDSVSSAAGVMSCGNALATFSCHALLENALPPDCRLANGARQNGRSCGSDAQCASTRCARAPNAACGTCSTLALAEQACTTNSDCGVGLICSATGVCRALAALGSSCDPGHPCAIPLICSKGSCVSPLALGAPCQWDDDRCDRYAGLLCSSGTCAPWLNASPGGRCGSTPDGWAVCSAGSTCSDAANGGSCEGPLRDDGPCNVDSGPKCLAPALCIVGSCAIVNPAACP